MDKIKLTEQAAAYIKVRGGSIIVEASGIVRVG